MPVKSSPLVLFSQFSTEGSGSLVVTALDSRVATRWSHVRFPAAANNTGMSGRLRAGKPLQYLTNATGPTQPPTLSGRETSTSQSAVTLCGWVVKAGMTHFTGECKGVSAR